MPRIKVVKETDSIFVFKDWKNHKIKMEIPSNVKKSPYNKKLFKFDENLRASYEGDPAFNYRLGIDVSRHEGLEIDWEKVKADGWDFVILRLGYRGYVSGILHLDENFHHNIKGAQNAGLDVGVYIYSQAINEEEALEEADLIISELKKYKISLPVVYDPESVPWEPARTDDLTKDQLTKNAIVFCNRIKEAGYEPMIYANLIWQAKYLDFSQLSEYKIWYAEYDIPPKTPFHFEMWQYSGEGVQVDGIKRKVDADIMLFPSI